MAPAVGHDLRVSRVRRPPVRAWVWTAVALVVAVVAVLGWRSSDAAATSSTTSSAPATATGAPGAQLAPAWSAPQQAPGVDGDVVVSGRVLTTDRDGVALVDPATGDEAWHYTRSNARLCGATAVDQLVVVLFSTGGRCNELTALRADTGERLWYRSVGFRADATLTSTDRIVLAVSPTGLATVDPSGNNIRWHHAAPAGCRITDARAGSTGVVALQQCDGQQQVVLLDGFAGTQTWLRDLGTDRARLVGADGAVDVVVGDALQTLSTADGSTLASTALPAGSDDDAPPLQTTADGTVLVWARGTALALDPSGGAVRWSVAATGLPATADAKGTAPAVLVPEGDALVLRDLTTGAQTGRSTLEVPLPTGARTEVVGDVVVASTPDLVTAHR